MENRPTEPSLQDVKPIAFYLPQYHPIPENDRNWGAGFTEWTNVTRATPLFPGHYQPHLPADLGFYDLRVPEVMEAQAALAQAHGVFGFSYYHYWFNGKLLLEAPLHRMLRDGRPDMPFCLCWANENWTRRWDGSESSTLIEQHYGAEDDLAHIRYLIPFFRDPRYIRVNGRPMFLMYRSELHPDVQRATEVWRNEAIRAGFPDLFLVRVENFERLRDPAEDGFDAGVEFSPSPHLRGMRVSKRYPLLHGMRRIAQKMHVFESAHLRHNIYSMRDVVDLSMAVPRPDYTRFRCVSPTWDNSARRARGATIYVDSSPQLFEFWAGEMAQQTRENLAPDHPFLFINAWNEWAEGCHLEPCLRWGKAYLQALARGLRKEK